MHSINFVLYTKCIVLSRTSALVQRQEALTRRTMT